MLLYDGEELVGAKQNRILNVSVLVEAKSSLRSPSRASSRDGGRAGPSASQPAATSRMRASAPQGRGSGCAPMARGVAQSDVWERCTRRPMRCSSTRRRVRARISTARVSGMLAHSRTRSPRSPGSAARFSGSGYDMCVDVVSPARRIRATLAQAARRLPARRASGISTGTDAARRSVQSWDGSQADTTQPSVGLGDDLRLRGEPSSDRGSISTASCSSSPRSRVTTAVAAPSAASRAPAGGGDGVCLRITTAGDWRDDAARICAVSCRLDFRSDRCELQGCLRSLPRTGPPQTPRLLRCTART